MLGGGGGIVDYVASRTSHVNTFTVNRIPSVDSEQEKTNHKKRHVAGGLKSMSWQFMNSFACPL